MTVNRARITTADDAFVMGPDHEDNVGLQDHGPIIADDGRIYTQAGHYALAAETFDRADGERIAMLVSHALMPVGMVVPFSPGGARSFAAALIKLADKIEAAAEQTAKAALDRASKKDS